MISTKQTRIVFVWHMHQPTYKSPATGEYLLPWVLVHAMRDYYDMPALAAKVGGVKPTFNLVPGMLAQLQEYAAGAADDRFWRTAMKPPAELTTEEKLFLLDNFFVVHPETMLKPFPRFAELADKAASCKSDSQRQEQFLDQEFVDLQVLYFLSWTGLTLREDPRVRELLARGRGFAQEDKDKLSLAVADHLGKIIPLHRDLVADGSIEVSCSPMYHPILPLLVDTDSAKEAMPDAPLPHQRFSFPQDAAAHVSRGLDLVSGLLGRRVTGMWPSEGSVSTPVMELLGDCGVEWICTDASLLLASLPDHGGRSRQDLIYAPWRYGRTAMFFRDTTLSDLIGFTYSSWQPEDAVRHFLGQLAAAADSSNLERPVITIAMDGENAWEYYLHGGMKFVELLYEALARDERFQVVSPSDVLRDAEPERLERVAAGSWIDGNFGTWIGDPVKNRGWDYLVAARQAVESYLASRTPGDAERADLLDLVHRAEASDWFWWFGHGHTTTHDAEFDLLFRQHLQAIYLGIGAAEPEYLRRPVEAHPDQPASSEYRYDPVQQRWVVVATERGKRPQEFRLGSEPDVPLDECPFCRGREDLTPPEIVRWPPRSTGPDWQVRVIPNRFPALQIEGVPERVTCGAYARAPGVGAHEVIVETSRHGIDLADLPVEDVAAVVNAYKERLLDLSRDVRLRYTLVFKNHGGPAGASLSHAHSQVVSTTILPRTVATELASAGRHFREEGKCLFCTLLAQELEDGSRMVLRDEQFATYCPYASRFPFEMHLLPLRHHHDFTSLDGTGLLAFAGHLKETLGRMNKALNNPPFNFMLHTAPNCRSDAVSGDNRHEVEGGWHWHLEILPRLTNVAGFEWGSGFFINSTAPEVAARYLRRADP